MRRRAEVVALAGMAAAVVIAAGAAAADSPAALATRLLDQLDAGQYAAAEATFSPQMKAAYDAVLASLTDAMLDMLEVNSARQANQKREGVPGYSKNYLQNFAKRAQWHEASIANTYTSDLFTDAFREMQTAVDERQKVSAFEAERGQLVHDELATRFSNALKPVDAPFIHALSVFGNNFYLALSPAYAIGNLMQPYMLTLPYLGGRYGFVKAAKTMARSSRDTAKIMSQAIASSIPPASA